MMDDVPRGSLKLDPYMYMYMQIVFMAGLIMLIVHSIC